LRCTAEAGGAEYDCTPYEYDDMVAKDKLYAEAEAVYRKFLAEEVRVLRAGGVSQPTAVLLETAHGEFLSNVMETYRSLAERKTKAVGADPKLVYFRRAPGRSKGGSMVSATTCVDGAGLRFEKSGKAAGNGEVAVDEVYFARFDGELKLIGADGSQVASCD
jgi:hypothetical protein